MANYSVQELLSWMDGKSRTYGWDAVVAYDRHKTNVLLHQQYVQRFDSESYIPPISVALPSSAYTTEQLFGLKLSVPQLSFANANLMSSKADLTMDMSGGLIVSKITTPGLPQRTDSIKQLMPLGSPQLTMTLPLETTPTSISEQEVTLDISKGQDFRANFVVGELPQTTVGEMFKAMFQRLDAKQKVYSLGRLNEALNDVMTPVSFQLRTMASPTGGNRLSEDYGDGAVMMFIQFQGGTPGNIPPMPQPGNPDGFRYLIPRADQVDKFSGTLLLSSRILLKEILSPHLTNAIGKGLVYRDDPPASDRASTLEAISGTTDDSWIFSFKCLTTPGGQPSTLECRVTNMRIPFTYRPPYDGHRVHAQNNMLTVSWGSMQTSHMRPFPMNPNWKDVYFDLHFTSVMHLRADIEGARGIVKLKSNAPVANSIYVNPHDSTSMAWNVDLKEVTQREITARVVSKVNEVFNSIDVPGIDTFLSRNLLFPGHDALQLSRAYIPGDLALFGHIDPISTSLTLWPSKGMIEAGSTLQFIALESGVSGVLWSVRDSDGDRLDIGTISASGLYRAPEVSALDNGYVTVVVTAEGRQNNQLVKTSALVSIIDSSISANPIFKALAPEQEVTLSGDTIDGSAPSWSLLMPGNGASLTPAADNSHHRVYKAGPQSNSAFTLDTVQVKSVTGQPKSLKMLIANWNVTLSIRVTESSEPESGSVKLEVLYDNEVLDPAEVPYELELLEGGGELDARTGIYKEPDSSRTSVAIITVGAMSEFGELGFYGFIALPLPLTRYATEPPVFDELDPSRGWRDLA